MAKTMIPYSVDLLREALRYDPLKGCLVWRSRPVEHFRSEHAWKIWMAKFPETIAGSIVSKSNGYRRIMVAFTQCGVRFNKLASRITWELNCGPIADGAQVDHINGNSLDNRIENLRLADNAQNCSNQGKRKTNKCGYKGVSRTCNKYQAQIMHRGKKKYLGLYETPESAHAAYCAASKELNGEFSRT